MTRRLAVASALLWMSLVTLLVAQERTPQFQFERVITAAPQPGRLAIDVPMLIGSQPFTVVPGPAADPERQRFVAVSGLGDLRLFNASGGEVPYLLVPPPLSPDTWINGRVFAIAATKKTSGFEVVLDEPRIIDRLRFDDLRPPFLKRVTIEASGDRERWTVLLPQATVFDLPDQRLRGKELAFPRGTYRYLRATWDDTNSAVMPTPQSVSLRVVVPSKVGEAPSLAVALSAAKVSSEPGRSRYQVNLPGARLPIVAVEPQVDAPYVFREAIIGESRLANGRLAPFALGRGFLRQVVRDQLTASSMRISIVPPSEPQIDVSVLDGDNPPLAIAAVTARFAELPWIYFEHGGGPLVARWGDRRLHAPRYDLEAVRPSLNIDGVKDATWGEVRRLTPATTVSAPTPLPNAGAAIETDRFRYTRAIPPGELGLIAVSLDPAVLAHSTGVRTFFADVRIVDASGRQIPYLVEQRDEPLSVELRLEPRTAPATERAAGSRSRSYYRVRLPYAHLPPWTLVLATNATVFERQLTLAAERPADAAHRDDWHQVIASGHWIHTDREKPAAPLSLHASTADATDLLLTVDEGDNSPLPIASARLLLPSYRLRLFRDPGASLRLLYGREDIGPPSYDLALLSASVLGVPAREVVPADEQPVAGAASTVLLGSRRLFWSVLGVAVLAMLAVLVRLIRRET